MVSESGRESDASESGQREQSLSQIYEIGRDCPGDFADATLSLTSVHISSDSFFHFKGLSTLAGALGLGEIRGTNQEGVD